MTVLDILFEEGVVVDVRIVNNMMHIHCSMRLVKMGRISVMVIQDSTESLNTLILRRKKSAVRNLITKRKSVKHTVRSRSTSS